MKVEKGNILLVAYLHGEDRVMAYCKKCGTELPEGAKFCPVCGTPVTIEAAPASVSPATSQPSGLKLALWGERFLAWLIDVIIVGVVVGILGLFSLLAGVTWWSSWPGWLPFFNLNVGSILYFLYWLFMDGAYGQSFGKMIMRIKIARLDGSQIGMGNAAIESVGKAFLLPLDCLLGWILYPKRRQRILNYISATIVIKET